MIKLIDENGRFVPALARLFNLVWLISGLVLGWLAHSNWSLRGEANQLVDDAKEMQQIEKRFDEEEDALEKRIENAKRKKVDDCLLYPVDTLNELRGKSGEAGQQIN